MAEPSAMLRSVSIITFVLGFALLAGPAGAEPADIKAAVADADRPEKTKLIDMVRKPVEVLQFLGLQRGGHALDLFGSGSYYGRIMARAVGPEGSVDAWEAANFSSPKSRKSWNEIEATYPNMKLLVSPANRIQLSENKYDFVMFNLNYHDLYWESTKFNFPRMDPKPFVRTVFNAMKPGAVIGVIDHVANPGGDVRKVAQDLHRIDPARVKADFEAAGFVLEAESPVLRNPADDHSKNVFDEAIRFRTDQLIYRFRKPANVSSKP
ncbi:methyltransferase [Sphingomonas sp. NSE70-1]|uniref:Methyltransferase n=1 Tax=Sphingomonas caseinilyticus TaxID=2908205 RepID=A0ABT0RRQ0_9SPHN|nr:methyltransferase [Sphingomonas caseinilyticus]MCL6697350.1 methyltransferase [Sphingomonas caseinilyticus]